METKTFSLRVVLTVTTGRLLTKPNGEDDNGIGDLYEILEWMTGESPFTHQLPRFGKECVPHLFRWFPELQRVDSTALGWLSESIKELGPEPGVLKWLERVQSEYHLSPNYAVPMIPKNDHKSRDPIKEMQDMVGDKGKLIVVEL